MPVPKGKQKLYGKIVGANINKGKSLEQAKNIADSAVMPTSKGVTTPSKGSSNAMPKAGESIKIKNEGLSKGTASPSKSRLRQNKANKKDIVKVSMHGNTKF